MVSTPRAEDALFEREIELEERELARLLELLADEQRVLTRQDDDRLIAIAAEKAKHLDSLERLGRRRNDYLKRCGMRADGDGMLDWLSARPERDLAARAWTRLEENTRRAREANRINGALISDRMQSFQRRLAFFNAVACNDPTYSPDGFTRPSPPRRILSEA
jgi:flagellar biosynthesis/type III secretory pathway chaperone